MKIWWGEFFKDKFPRKTVHPELISLKIAYTTLIEDYIEAKTPIPPAVMQNYHAAQAFNIDGFTDKMRNTIQCLMKGHEENGTEKESRKKDQDGKKNNGQRFILKTVRKKSKR